LQSHLKHDVELWQYHTWEGENEARIFAFLGIARDSSFVEFIMERSLQLPASGIRQGIEAMDNE